MAGYHMHTTLLERLQTGILRQAVRILWAKASIIGGLETVQPLAAWGATVLLSSQGSQAVLHPHVVIKGINNCIASQTDDRVADSCQIYIRFVRVDLDGEIS
jgi:hypothetical protein